MADDAPDRHRQGIADGIALSAAVLRELPLLWAEAFPTGVAREGDSPDDMRAFVAMLGPYAKWVGTHLSTVANVYPAPTHSPEKLDAFMARNRASAALDMAMGAASVGARPLPDTDY